MKTRKLFDWLLLLVCILLGGISVSTRESKAATTLNVPVTVQEDYDMAEDFFEYVNAQRVSAGLNAYKMDSVLIDVAMQRAVETILFDSHSSPRDGRNNGVCVILDKKGMTTSVFLNDNIGNGFGNAYTAYSFWYNSQGHRPALVSSEFNYCGIGVIQYHKTAYWAFVVSDHLYGKVVSSVAGMKKNCRTVEILPQLLIPSDETISVYYNSGKTSNELYFDNGAQNGTRGYYAEDSSNFNIKNNNPELFSVDALGRVTAKKVGSGSMTVTVSGGRSYTVPVKIRAQEGSSQTSDGKRLEFSSTLAKKTYEYTGKAITPKPVVKDWYGNVMTEGIDYYLTYEDNVEEGDFARIIVHPVKGGNYDSGLTEIWDARINFSIVKTAVTPSKPGNGGNTGGNTGNTGNTGSTTPSKPGAGGNTGDSGNNNGGSSIEGGISGTINDTNSGKPDGSYGADIIPLPGTPAKPPVPSDDTKNAMSVKLSKTSVTYNGKAQKPAVKVVTVNGKKLAKKYYSVKYKNHKNCGYGMVTVKGKGSYAKYSCTVKFKIHPRKVTLSSVKAGKGKAVAKWKKTGGISGYQVVYSTDRKFKNAQSKNCGAKSGSVTLKVGAKKTYYVRVRSYKKVGKEVWYSGWSSVKKVKVK